MFVTTIFCEKHCEHYEERGRSQKWDTFLEAIKEKNLMEDETHFVRITLDPEFETTLDAEKLLGTLRVMAFKFNEEVEDTSRDEIIAYSFAEYLDCIERESDDYDPFTTEETK